MATAPSLHQKSTEEYPPCPVHRMLNKLRQFAGLPVPFMVQWYDGKPDFRVMDSPKVVECVEKKLCGICGERLGDTAWWIGGPLTLEHHLFTDPAMHKTCALESIRLCPFLNGKRQSNRKGGFHPDAYANPHVDLERPSTMYLMYGWTKNMRLSTEIAAIESGKIAVERTF